MRALHSRPDIAKASEFDASRKAQGVLSRGVGLRGFESHPPHQFITPWMETSNVSSQNFRGRARFDFSPGEDHYWNDYSYHERQNY